VIDVDDKLIGSEVEREFLGQILGSGAATRHTRRSSEPAEELGIGGQVKSDLRLGAAGSNVYIGPVEGRLELEVQVEVNI
jgi:hypothetical protein